MILKIKSNNKKTHYKTRYYLTATLLSPLRPGQAATYIYDGQVFKTALVKAILEAAPSYVCFETTHSIYTLGHIRHDTENYRLSA